MRPNNNAKLKGMFIRLGEGSQSCQEFIDYLLRLEIGV